MSIKIILRTLFSFIVFCIFSNPAIANNICHTIFNLFNKLETTRVFENMVTKGKLRKSRWGYSIAVLERKFDKVLGENLLVIRQSIRDGMSDRSQETAILGILASEPRFRFLARQFHLNLIEKERSGIDQIYEFTLPAPPFLFSLIRSLRQRYLQKGKGVPAQFDFVLINAEELPPLEYLQMVAKGRLPLSIEKSFFFHDLNYHLIPYSLHTKDFIDLIKARSAVITGLLGSSVFKQKWKKSSWPQLHIAMNLWAGWYTHEVDSKLYYSIHHAIQDSSPTSFKKSLDSYLRLSNQYPEGLQWKKFTERTSGISAEDFFNLLLLDVRNNTHKYFGYKVSEATVQSFTKDLRKIFEKEIKFFISNDLLKKKFTHEEIKVLLTKTLQTLDR